MALFSMACIAMVRLGACVAEPDPQLVDPTPFAQAAMADSDLSAVHGMGLPTVGLEQRDAAEAATTTPVGQTFLRPSDLVREMTDNWNIQVAAVLIADATNRAR